MAIFSLDLREGSQLREQRTALQLFDGLLGESAVSGRSIRRGSPSTLP
jgi:hypothetical protein